MALRNITKKSFFFCHYCATMKMALRNITKNSFFFFYYCTSMIMALKNITENYFFLFFRYYCTTIKMALKNTRCVARRSRATSSRCTGCLGTRCIYNIVGNGVGLIKNLFKSISCIANYFYGK